MIPHQWDFHREVNPFPQDLAATLREAGHVVHFGTMLFHTGDLYESTVPAVMANLLRCFCQGFKVCFEIVLMATDAGHVKSGEQIIAIAGTGRGSDTALVMQAASSQHLKKLRVNEILCKPLNPLNIEEHPREDGKGNGNLNFTARSPVPAQPETRRGDVRMHLSSFACILPAVLVGKSCRSLF